MAIRAGRFRYHGTIERATVTTDAAGQQAVSEWTAVGAPVLVSLTSEGGDEGATDTGGPSVLRYRVGMHYRSDVRGSDRLAVGDRILRFLAPPYDPDGARRMLVADAVEVVTP